jgi:hypothetical protein
MVKKKGVEEERRTTPRPGRESHFDDSLDDIKKWLKTEQHDHRNIKKSLTMVAKGMEVHSKAIAANNAHIEDICQKLESVVTTLQRQSETIASWQPMAKTYQEIKTLCRTIKWVGIAFIFLASALTALSTVITKLFIDNSWFFG